MVQKITTIEGLAMMIQQTMASKDDVQELRREMNERFEQIDERFEQVDKRFEQVDKRFQRMDERFDHLDARVGRIEADIHELRDEVVYRHEFEDVLGRVKYLERKLGIESGV